MDKSTAISVASFTIAVIALAAALAQVTIQFSIEQRRKGKTDTLALGDWAINWPQVKLSLCLILEPFHIQSPWGDPRLLSVPFITVKAVEDYLLAEASATMRSPLERRMTSRLVESASKTIATGGGPFTGRMYAVRATTRKRSEACWSDAMDMCGMTRRFWPLLTGVGAQACDGAVRPANAVTNLHSLWGYARTMGLRGCIREGTKITFTNGGAFIYLDQYAGHDRPTRLAHFSGSPNGRYKIVEEMSQQTGQSVYADTVWSCGHIPLMSRLELNIPATTEIQDPQAKLSPIVAKERIKWLASLELQDFARQSWQNLDGPVKLWSSSLLETFRRTIADNPPEHSTDTDIVQFVERRNAAVASCIRSYPINTMSMEEFRACNQALLWCIDHWWLNPYEMRTCQYTPNGDETPRLPDLKTAIISCEFITDIAQTIAWCEDVLGRECMSVERHCWKACRKFAVSRLDSSPPSDEALSFTENYALIKVLQCWRLFLIYGERTPQQSVSLPGIDNSDTTTCLLILLTMALVAIANDSSKVGDVEDNKAMEIELG
jgi:hypothetical protein